MASRLPPKIFYGNWRGISTHESKRGDPRYLQEAVNFDTNVNKGSLVSRKGHKILCDDKLDYFRKMVEWRNEDASKDNLLGFSEHTTVASRALWLYTRDSDTEDQYVRFDGAGPPDHSSGITYGNVELGDAAFGVNMFIYRNMVRIGTGTGANNKALLFGYWNRENFFNVAALDFSGYFVCKQQWVQKNSLFSRAIQMIYDSTYEKWYVLTSRGVEIRDTNFYLEQIFNDVVAWKDENYYYGGLALYNNRLYACGKVPGSNDTKVIYYQVDEGYELSSDLSSAYVFSKDHSNNDYIHSICCDGTYVYVTWSDRTTAATPDTNIEELGLDLAASNNRYNNTESAATDFLIGITYDGTYVYAILTTSTPSILRMLKVSAYTTATYALNSADGYYIAHYSGNLYWVRSEQSIRELATASFGTPGSDTQDYAGQSNEQITSIYLHSDGTPYLFSFGAGVVIEFDDTTNWTKQKYHSGKIHLYAFNPVENSFNWVNMTSFETVFYAVSIVDIWGQEHHLMSGIAIQTNFGVGSPYIYLYVNIEAEEYEEQSASVSTSITALNSSWNDFRRIDKFRIYRADNSDNCASEPTSSYRLLKEIDFDDSGWEELISNKLYRYKFSDTESKSTISSVDFEQSSGLPEVFKPYYTNWKYVIESGGYFYYGNVRTDKIYIQKFLESPLNAPDICYELDTNFENFGIEDGNPITGFGEYINRFYVFKEAMSALYFGLKKEVEYPVGCYAPDSIISFQNIVYFVAKDGIFLLVPSGPHKISLDVDSFIVGDTNLIDASVALFTEKEKILWLIPNSDNDCWVFNYREKTWNHYQFSLPDTLDIKYIMNGINNRILMCGDVDAGNDGYFYLFNIGRKDALAYDETGGENMTINFTGNIRDFMGGTMKGVLNRGWIVFKSATNSLILSTKSRNESHSADQTLQTTIGTINALMPKEVFFPNTYFHSLWATLASTITDEVIIHSIIYEANPVDF